MAAVSRKVGPLSLAYAFNGYPAMSLQEVSKICPAKSKATAKVIVRTHLKKSMLFVKPPTVFSSTCWLTALFFCPIFRKVFNTKTALFIYQPPKHAQKNDSRES